MTSASDQPVLRLVGRERPKATLRVQRIGKKPGEDAHKRVASENISANRTAQTLDATDARWVLAIRVAEAIEGGRAAILTPERRQRLLRLAVKMGLREFDANLVIAIVQDAARTGELDGRPGQPASGLSSDVESRLKVVREPSSGTQSGDGLDVGMQDVAVPWWAVIATLLLAGLLWLGAMLWLDI